MIWKKPFSLTPPVNFTTGLAHRLAESVILIPSRRVQLLVNPPTHRDMTMLCTSLAAAPRPALRGSPYNGSTSTRRAGDAWRRRRIDWVAVQPAGRARVESACRAMKDGPGPQQQPQKGGKGRGRVEDKVAYIRHSKPLTLMPSTQNANAMA